MARTDWKLAQGQKRQKVYVLKASSRIRLWKKRGHSQIGQLCQAQSTQLKAQLSQIQGLGAGSVNAAKQELGITPFVFLCFLSW